MNTNPDDIAVYWRWISLYCLISLINLHWAVRWPKTDTVCRPSTCMRGRKGHIWAPPESVRTDSWLGGDPFETVLSSPLTWQEPSGQKSLFLVLFQREHIRENTITPPPPSLHPKQHGYNGTTCGGFYCFCLLHTNFTKTPKLANLVGVRCRYWGGGTLVSRVHSTMQHPDLQLELNKKEKLQGQERKSARQRQNAWLNLAALDGHVCSVKVNIQLKHNLNLLYCHYELPDMYTVYIMCTLSAAACCHLHWDFLTIIFNTMSRRWCTSPLIYKDAASQSAPDNEVA